MRASPPESAARFERLAPIGSGGAATVWKALDRRTGAHVALKVLHAHLRTDSVVCARFRREVEIGQALSHPAFVKVFDLCEEGDTLAFPMELLEGRTLKERIYADGPLPVDEVRRIARACLEGLAFAHQQGVVHRDFKPQNVFLCASGEVRLLDFGFAHTNAAAGLTTKSVVLCTPDYAPPEIVGGSAVDGRADLYSLGASLFEALTGQVPFRGASSFELLRQHLTAAPPRVRSLAPEVPAALDALVARLLEKKPEDRFPTASAVLSQLDLAEAPLALRPAECCPACGEPRAANWPVCPSCGAAADGTATAGDFMVILTRPPGKGGPARVAEALNSVGAEPAADLPDEELSNVPAMLLKNVSEPLGRLLRDRCRARDLQVELRSTREGNSDLLRGTNTAALTYWLVLFLPWAAVLGAGVWYVTQAGGPTGLTLGLLCGWGVAGPAAAFLAHKKAHLLIPSLGRVRTLERASAVPQGVLDAWHRARARVQDAALKGTLVRLFERALTIASLHQSAAPAVQLLFDESRDAAMRLVEQACALAVAAQEQRERLALLDEPRHLTELEALRSRRATATGSTEALDAAIAAHEEAVREAGALEASWTATSHRLLAVASALELTSVQLAAAGVAEPTGTSVEVKRLLEEGAFAARAARDLSRDPG